MGFTMTKESENFTYPVLPGRLKKAFFRYLISEPGYSEEEAKRITSSPRLSHAAFVRLASIFHDSPELLDPSYAEDIILIGDFYSGSSS